MNIRVVANTDIGPKRETNQDSICVKQAQWQNHTVFMAMVCDGMGGLSKGEVASGTVVTAFAEWFEQALPRLLPTCSVSQLAQHANTLIVETSDKMKAYGAKHGITLGTTISMLLAVDEDYCMLHAGDSRIYRITKNTEQLTTDHTVVAREIANGTMTPEEALHSPLRSKLTQCIGATRTLNPEVKLGSLCKGEVYLLCSDGFRHQVSADELQRYFNARALPAESKMEAQCKKVTELVIKRGEKDNISVVLCKVE